MQLLKAETCGESSTIHSSGNEKSYGFYQHNAVFFYFLIVNQKLSSYGSILLFEIDFQLVQSLL